MTKSVCASEVSGTSIAPSSKSIAQRAIVAALLASGTSILRNLTLCDDTEAALSIAKILGADVKEDGYDYHIISKSITTLPQKEQTLFCGESGLLTRMIIPVASLLSSPVTITGNGSILGRPIDMIEKPLQDLGVCIRINRGFLPAVIEGPLKGGTANIDGNISSQILTGLLLALPLAKQDSAVYVHNLKSKPYIDLTIDLLQSFGIVVENKNYEIFRINGNQQYRAISYNIEGDWSAASCLLVAGVIAGEVTINNLDTNSLQADKAILDALQLANTNVCIRQNKPFCSVTTTYSNYLKPFEFDANECPDLFPALVVLASNCNGISKIHGTKRLPHKESNRALALQQEFGKLGITIAVNDDTMLITGGTITGGKVSSHNDHRIAMALATAALKSTGKVIISGAESVNKSYPQFWNDLQSLTKQ
ncbi:MAG: 3-phosphoshikimate 1-carboxyvinyltransferase [Prevotellaceae bacterium]|jgi:3-phosphoshikimate 1-carboxyvinyltransferase|nr:3-phosphoshikimate 1-carboxyvinyltransferase [Prevotellaceae bacterium]